MNYSPSSTQTVLLIFAGLAAIYCTPSPSVASNHETLSQEETIVDEKALGFKAALESIFPMSPEMVTEFLKVYRQNEKSILTIEEPEPLVDHELISLNTGVEPHSVIVAPGIATAMGFYDATGTPWPVQQVVLGNSENFKVIQLGERANTITISPLVRVGWTNIVVALLNEPNPVVLKVTVGEDKAHYRINFQVTKHGPLASTQEVETNQPLPKAGSKDLLSALTGTFTSDEAKKVSLNGVDAEAWIKDKNLFIRSRYPLLSPTWHGSLKGPAGMRSYQLPIHSVLLFAVGERIVQAELPLEELTGP